MNPPPRSVVSVAGLASLVVLVLQNSVLVVLTRYSRIEYPLESRYYPSTLVFAQEVFKMLLCLFIFAFDVRTPRSVAFADMDATENPPAARSASPPPPEAPETFRSNGNRRLEPLCDLSGCRATMRSIPKFVVLYLNSLRRDVVKADTLLLFVPAVLFTCQNLLLFVGLSNLDAMTFQVWSQTKLLSTAIFSHTMLKRYLNAAQWASLVLLTLGILLSQTPSISSSKPNTSPATTPSRAHVGNTLVGISSCVLSGLSSSYASVYFERVVKTTSPTLAIRNIQLSLFGIPLALLSILLLDVVPSFRGQYNCGQDIHWNVFRGAPRVSFAALDPLPMGLSPRPSCPVRPFSAVQGYDLPLTWAVVVVHGLGGFLVAVVVKYADNISKGFATGVAVILSGIMSSYIWRYHASTTFMMGATLVTAATILFFKFEQRNNNAPKLTRR